MRHFRLLAVAVAALTLTATSQARTPRSLTDSHVGTSKSELVAQKTYSAAVVNRLGHSWQFAPRHATCWSHVPWAKLCNHTRLTVFHHRRLLKLASVRLAAIVPLYPPHHALWTCISRFEGGVTSVNRNGHYGMLQMSWNWLGLINGAASDYPQSVQEWAAERAYAANHYRTSFLYGQWFDYDRAAGTCLGYA